MSWPFTVTVKLEVRIEPLLEAPHVSVEPDFVNWLELEGHGNICDICRGVPVRGKRQEATVDKCQC